MPKPLIWKLTIAGLLLAGLLVPTLSGTRVARAQTPTKTDAWTAEDCATFQLTNVPAGVECGFVTVPLRHAEPDGPTIQLGTVILPSTTADRQPDPLFIAQGGPGGTTIGTYAQVFILAPQYRPAPNRDIVLWDQRGTKFSRPVLSCPEVEKANLENAVRDIQPSAEVDPLAGYTACGTRLASEVGDLSAFNSAENADDAEAVRAALGYEQFNFYGVSYGTELGQFVMRRQPQNVRSVILDAVVPSDYNLFTEPAFAKQRIAEKYFGACAAQERCNAAFPDLATRYLALVERLNATPVTLTVAPPPNITAAPAEGEPLTYQVRLTGSGLESALYSALYGDVHDLIPLIIDRADRGDFTYAADFLLPSALFSDGAVAEGMHLTVICADFGDTDPDAVDYSSLNQARAEQERTSARAEVGICDAWNVELLPREQLEPVQSEIPVLLLSGDFDPITPPEYAARLLPNLPNSQHVIFPLGSHGQVPLSACANGLLATFLNNPGAPLDTSCVPTDIPNFVTEADVIDVPVVRDALATGGLGSDNVFIAGLSAVPGLISVLVLFTGLLVFPIGWLLGRKRSATERGGWTRPWAGAAPWIALALAVVLLVFFIGFGLAVGSTFSASQNLFLLGAIPGSWRPLFYLPLLAVVLTILMAVSTVALWVGRHRSVAGRVYYTILLSAAIAALASLGFLQVFGVAFG